MHWSDALTPNNMFKDVTQYKVKHWSKASTITTDYTVQRFVKNCGKFVHLFAVILAALVLDSRFKTSEDGRKIELTSCQIAV
jgi:hypothetical protein